MKSFFGSKKGRVVIILLVLVLLGGAGYYFFVKKDSGSNSGDDTAQVEPKEKKVDNVFTYISSEDSTSAFAEYTTGLDITAKQAELSKELQNGATVTMMVFVPDNDSFDTDEAALLDKVPAALKDDLRWYYFASYSPNTDGSAPDLSLSDAQRIKMVNGRDVTVKKKGSSFYIVDAKGREAKVQPTYVTDQNGNRIYVIDNILLLQ